MSAPPEPRGGEGLQFTMQDVRLAAGEGKLSAHDVLNAVNAILRNRRPSPPVAHGWPDREAVARVIFWETEELYYAPDDADCLKLADRILALFPPVVGWRMVPVEPDRHWILTQAESLSGSKSETAVKALAWNLTVFHRRLLDRVALPAAPLTDGVGE